MASCASPAKLRQDGVAKSSAVGNFQGAIDNIERNKKKLYNAGDAFLLEFDLGLLHHYNENYRESIRHLARAAQILEDLYSRSVTNEAASLLTNDNIRPYRSYPFEIQWLYQTQILNFLALGDIDGAAVEARRAQLAVQALREKEDKKFNESGSLQYLRALTFEWQANSVRMSADDARIAYDFAKRSFGNYVPRQLSQIPEHEQEIVVIGYAGLSPVLRENKFWGTYAPDGVLFLNYRDAHGRQQTLLLTALGLGGPGFSGRTMTIQFAIPQMVERVSQTSKFSVNVNSKPQATETFSSTKRGLEKDLENGQTTTLIRTAGRVVTRTIAANKAKDRMQTGNGLVDLLLNIGTDIGTGALEEADLRIGSALPSTLQIVRIPVEPGKHSVSIDVLDHHGRKMGSSAEQFVNVKKGEKVFLFAPMLR
ncbi:MAG: hypothetical protein LBC85_03975 [Fibromonadaceae bacterium]|nr:hypothetical protein [Fibromonadaceae bacterium]